MFLLQKNGLSDLELSRVSGGANDPVWSYTVKEGDELGMLATNYHCTVDELKRLNNLSTETLEPGKTLKIPYYKAK